MENKGNIYNIQHYCIHDGPGIRTDIFFKGCNFHCPWCANPESINGKRQLSFMAHKCTKCGLCVAKCPNQALDLQIEERIDSKKCDLCGICVRYCPKNCYTVYGKEYTVEELIYEVEKDIPYYKNSGGGVTVTGGEPTLQHRFLVEFLSACKERGIHTAMESNISCTQEVLDQIAPYVDLFLADVKHMDSKIHQQTVGQGNEAVLRNIRHLTSELGKKVSIRVPCIPGFNVTDENMELLKEFALEIQKTGCLQMVHLLPYHNLGMGKYDSLGMDYSMRNIKPLSETDLLPYKNSMEQAGLQVKIGG